MTERISQAAGEGESPTSEANRSRSLRRRAAVVLFAIVGVVLIGAAGYATLNAAEEESARDSNGVVGYATEPGSNALEILYLLEPGDFDEAWVASEDSERVEIWLGSWLWSSTESRSLVRYFYSLRNLLENVTWCSSAATP